MEAKTIRHLSRSDWRALNRINRDSIRKRRQHGIGKPSRQPSVKRRLGTHGPLVTVVRLANLTNWKIYHQFQQKSGKVSTGS